jgi:hypothetical protein
MPEGTNSQHMKKIKDRGNYWDRPAEPKKQRTLDEFEEEE